MYGAHRLHQTGVGQGKWQWRSGGGGGVIHYKADLNILFILKKEPNLTTLKEQRHQETKTKIWNY